MEFNQFLEADDNSTIVEKNGVYDWIVLKKDDGFYSIGGGESVLFNKKLYNEEWKLIAQNISKFCILDNNIMLLDVESNLWVAGNGSIFGIEGKLDTINNFTKVIDIAGISNDTKTLLTNNVKDIGLCYGGSFVLLKNNSLYVSGITKRNWFLE